VSSSNLQASEPALTLADYTSPGLIIPKLRGLDAPAIIQELSAALQREGRIIDVLPFYQAALNREYLCSTVTEPGWALPHVLVKGLERPCFALGRTAAPIAWGNNVLRVQVIFLLAAPETDARAYITLVLALARLSRETHLLDRLLKTSDPLEVFDVLRQVRMPVHRSPQEGETKAR
jgi:mannitol/fructose-specific phosphotransferase system IIA component (Ntr-type)